MKPHFRLGRQGRAGKGTAGPSEDIIAVSEALDKLAAQEPAVADLVKLHYFCGLTLDQVAQLRGIGRRTAVKHLAYARAWLHREITGNDEPGSHTR